MNKIIIPILIVFACLSTPVLAESLDAKAQSFTTTLEKQLQKATLNKSGGKASLKVLIEDVILVNVDAKYFAYKVLGKNLAKLSEEQRAEFVQLLKSAMINDYISVLKNYNNEKLSYDTVQMAESGKTGKSFIRVLPPITEQKPERKIALMWRYQKDDDTWLIYDLEAEGISLLQSKHKEILGAINKHGIDGTLALLKDKSIKAL